MKWVSRLYRFSIFKSTHHYKLTAKTDQEQVRHTEELINSLLKITYRTPAVRKP